MLLPFPPAMRGPGGKLGLSPASGTLRQWDIAGLQAARGWHQTSARGAVVIVEKASLGIIYSLCRHSLQRGPSPTRGLCGGLTTPGEQAGQVQGTSIYRWVN